MNRPIRVMALGALVMFVALLINVNLVQFIQADDLNAKADNRRVIDEDFSRDRGPILVAGNAIAQSVKSHDRFHYRRAYPRPVLYSNLTGYYSYIYGSRGIENSENSILSGDDPRLFVNRVIDLVGSSQPKGGQVSLTINPAAQRAASDGLAALPGTTKGAVVALDPSTGAILAMVTSPTYNANRYASHDLRAVVKAGKQLSADKADPLTDRSRLQIYPPGSTFKLVTASAALSDAKLKLTPSSRLKAGPTLSFPGFGYHLTNEDDSVCGAATLTFTQALDASCNVVFGRLALRVGAKALQAQADRFGFGDSGYLDDLSLAASQFKTAHRHTLNQPQTAQSGIGQFEVAATPLQMAMVAAGIANGGSVMKPYLVSEIKTPDLQVLDRTAPQELSRAVSSSVAGELTDMMVDVVKHGTASTAAIPGVDVAAKTGTAQSASSRKPYAWFVSFAPAQNPKVAVAVLVQDNTGTARTDVTGGGLAGPIAKAVMEKVLP